MSYVPNFANDIFISYTHIDNEPLAQGKEGWISFFHTALRARLRQLLGAELAIWRDAKLQGNDYLSEALLRQFPQIAILVSILSPRYIQSQWCLRELQEFSQAAEHNGGLKIGEKVRLFKVVKTRIPLEQHPPALRGLLGYEFFDVDPQTDRPTEFLPEFGREEEYKFFKKLDDLAHDMRDLLVKLKARDEGKPLAPPSTNGAMIYLAQTTADLREIYETIRRELLAQRCTILPDGELPLHNTAELKRRVSTDLGRCKFSIHLVGQNYSLVPEGETRSLIELQHDLAEEISRATAFSRVIWLPPGLQTPDERQRKFIHALRTGAYRLERADLLETPLEELQSTIVAKLRNGKIGDAGAIAPAGPIRIYLICDAQDLAAVKPIDDYLFAQGFEVESPVFEGNETQIREAHQDKLLHCDAALIFGGAITDAWLSSKKADLQKVYGWGRRQPLRATAIYLTGPETAFKQRFRSHTIKVLKSFAAFSPAVLAPFVNDLNRRRQL